MLRVVAVSRIASGSGESTGVIDIVPDPTRRRPGRGAHLHFDPACLAQAVKRRAFGRALRVTGVTETNLVEAHLATRGNPISKTSKTDGEA
jgi:predicted RNA-binding protein YlxR (DUF448 family)